MQHKYDIDAIDQCLRDLLEVSNYLHLIALELTYHVKTLNLIVEYVFQLKAYI